MYILPLSQDVVTTQVLNSLLSYSAAQIQVHRGAELLPGVVIVPDQTQSGAEPRLWAIRVQNRSSSSLRFLLWRPHQSKPCVCVCKRVRTRAFVPATGKLCLL